jgi:hypothetical protein
MCICIHAHEYLVTWSTRCAFLRSFRRGEVPSTVIGADGKDRLIHISSLGAACA